MAASQALIALSFSPTHPVMNHQMIEFFLSNFEFRAQTLFSLARADLQRSVVSLHTQPLW